MRVLTPRKRSGVTLLIALLLMATLSFLMVTIAAQIVLNHRVVERRMHQVQALWLARSGVEVAVAQLAENPNYTGEILELIADSEVAIQVSSENGGTKIDVEAAYPKNGSHTVVRSLRR
jgi:type II secretory pathway component PulK